MSKCPTTFFLFSILRGNVVIDHGIKLQSVIPHVVQGPISLIVVSSKSVKLILKISVIILNYFWTVAKATFLLYDEVLYYVMKVTDQVQALHVKQHLTMMVSMVRCVVAKSFFAVTTHLYFDSILIRKYFRNLILSTSLLILLLGYFWIINIELSNFLRKLANLWILFFDRFVILYIIYQISL